MAALTVNFDSSHPFFLVLSYETLDFLAWRRASISHLLPMNAALCSGIGYPKQKLKCGHSTNPMKRFVGVRL
jgi:hypothetical protein